MAQMGWQITKLLENLHNLSNCMTTNISTVLWPLLQLIAAKNLPSTCYMPRILTFLISYNPQKSVWHKYYYLNKARIMEHRESEWLVKEAQLGFEAWPSASSCCCSVTKSCLTLCNPMDYSMPRFLVLHYLLEFAQTDVHWFSDAIQPPHPLLPPSPPTLNLSHHQGLFQWVSSLYKVAKLLELRFRHQSFYEYSKLISFMTDWFDLLAVQGTLKSLPQHHSSKASILNSSAFFMIQLSHLYMTIVWTIALTIWIFVGKVMALLFNILSRFVTVFLPRSKHLFVSLLQSPSAGILEPKKIKSATASIFSPSICHEVMGPDAMILVFWMLSFKPAFSLCSFTFTKVFSSPSLSAIRVVSPAYPRLSIFLPAILIPACAGIQPRISHDILCT